MLPNARKAGKNVLQTFMQVNLSMLIKFNYLMPVLAAFTISKMLLLKRNLCKNNAASLLQ